MLTLHQLIQIAVEGIFGDIGVNIDFGIFVTLTNDSAFTLLKIRRSPRTIQMMERHKLCLHVGSCAHFLRRAKQHTHLTGTHFAEQFFLLSFGICRVNIGDFLCGDAFCNQLVTEIIVYIELAVSVRSRQVAEDHLRGFLICRALPDVKDIIRTRTHLTCFAVGKHIIHKPLIESQLASVVSDEEHVIHARIDHLIADTLCSFRKSCNHLFLRFGRLQNDIVVMSLRHRQIQHIRRLNVSSFLEHCHKFRKIVELCKPCFGSVSGTFGRKLDSRHGLAKGACPGIKVNEVISAKCSILEILLHRVHLDHTVGDRSTGRKHNAASACQFIQIATLHIKVAGLHGFGLADTADISHLRKCGEILVVMCLINENTVNAKLFKGHNVVLAGLIVQLFEFLFDRFLGALQLLDGEVVAAISF